MNHCPARNHLYGFHMHFVKNKLLKNVNFGVSVQTLLVDPLIVILSMCWHCLSFTAAEGNELECEGEERWNKIRVF